MINFRKILILFLFCFGAAFGQNFSVINGIRRDTSYNLNTAAKKMYKMFPQAKLVTRRKLPNVKEASNIVYENIKGRKLHLNVFYPAKFEGNKYPGILMIYGGGWSSGDTSMVIPMARRLAAKGFVTVTPEYRLSPEALYPAAVKDLKTAVRWMKANAEKYRIDTGKIASYGCSAGGELASFLGTTDNSVKFNNGMYKGFSSDVQAVVNVDGLLDFTNINSTKYDENPDKPSAAHRWFGKSYKAAPGLWKEASPVTYAGLKTPPVIFINSGQQHYHAGRDDLIKILKKYNIYYEVRTFPGTHHTFWLFHPWFDKTFDYTVNFLNKVFKIHKGS